MIRIPECDVKEITYFVNKRLERLVGHNIVLCCVDLDFQEKVEDEIESINEKYSKFGTLSPDMEKRLLSNESFCQNAKILNFPEHYTSEDAGRDLIGLYKLIRVKSEAYVPTLSMEYALARMINDEISDYNFYIEKIDEPYRSDAKKTLKKAGCNSEEAENILSMYEDIREYPEVCFWDWDFKFLDEMTMQELEKSDLNKQLGILPDNDTLKSTPWEDVFNKERSEGVYIKENREKLKKLREKEALEPEL